MVLNQVFQFTHLLQKERTPEKLSLEDWASSKVRGARMPLNLWLTARGPFLALWNVRFDLPFHNMILIYKAVWSPWQKKKNRAEVLSSTDTHFFQTFRTRWARKSHSSCPRKAECSRGEFKWGPCKQVNMQICTQVIFTDSHRESHRAAKAHLSAATCNQADQLSKLRFPWMKLLLSLKLSKECLLLNLWK